MAAKTKRVVQKQVISLDGSPRASRFFTQDSAKGFERFPAFDGRQGAGRNRFDTAKFSDRYKRQPKGGEIGCAISHLEVMRAFSEEEGRSDDLLIVAEDDVEFAPEFDNVIERICRNADFEFALLGHPCEDMSSSPWVSPVRDWMPISIFARPVGEFPRPWKYRLGRTPGTVAGAGLYLITREAATSLVRHADGEGSISWVADDYEAWHRSAGVNRIQVLRPNLCGWNGGSEIGPDQPHLEVLRKSRDFQAASPFQRFKYRFGRQSWRRRWWRITATLSATFRPETQLTAPSTLR